VTDRHADFHGNFRGHRKAVCLSANAIGSKIFACHLFRLALSHEPLSIFKYLSPEFAGEQWLPVLRPADFAVLNAKTLTNAISPLAAGSTFPRPKS